MNTDALEERQPEASATVTPVSESRPRSSITVIFVTHRPSLLAEAEMVLRVDCGSIYVDRDTTGAVASCDGCMQK